MKTDSMIELPKDLFSAIDNAHARATKLYKSLSPEALELISPQRGDHLSLSKDKKNHTNNKLKIK